MVKVKLREQCDAPDEPLIGVTQNAEEDEAKNQIKIIRLGARVPETA